MVQLKCKTWLVYWRSHIACPAFVSCSAKKSNNKNNPLPIVNSGIANNGLCRFIAKESLLSPNVTILLVVGEIWWWIFLGSDDSVPGFRWTPTAIHDWVWRPRASAESGRLLVIIQPTVDDWQMVDEWLVNGWRCWPMVSVMISNPLPTVRQAFTEQPERIISQSDECLEYLAPRRSDGFSGEAIDLWGPVRPSYWGVGFPEPAWSSDTWLVGSWRIITLLHGWWVNSQLDGWIEPVVGFPRRV